MTKRKIIEFIFYNFLFFSFYLSIIWTINSSKHQIDSPEKWLSVKMTAYNPAMGDIQYLFDRNSVSQDRVNLAGWFGNQDLIISKPINGFSCIQMKAIFTNKSIAKFNFRTKQKIFMSLFLTNSPFEKSSWLKINEIGKYVYRKELESPPQLYGDRDIKLCKTADSIKLYIDDDFISENEVNFNGNDLYFSVGAANFDFYLDQIEIYDSSNKLLFYDDFNFPRSYSLIFLLSFFTSILFLLRFKLKNHVLMSIFSISIIVLSYFTCDYYIFTKLQPLESKKEFANQVIFSFLGWKNRIFETIPPASEFTSIAQSFSQHDFLYDLFDMEKIRNDATDSVVLGDKNANRRWLFLGTSQASGEGATKIEYQLPYRIYNDLKKSLNQEIFLTSFTLKGSNAENIYDYLLKNKINPLNFNHLLISLGNNDLDSHRFSHFLSKIIHWAKKNTNVKIFLVHEPNSPEDRAFEYLPNHLPLSKLAKSDPNIYLLNSSFLSSKEAFLLGDMWWDYVHMKNYGQYLYSKTLSTQLSQILKNK